MKLRTQIERKTAGKSRNEQTGAKNHRDAVLSCPKRMTAFRALGKIIRDLRLHCGQVLYFIGNTLFSLIWINCNTGLCRPAIQNFCSKRNIVPCIIT